MKKHLFLAFALLIGISISMSAKSVPTAHLNMDLSGNWAFALDPDNAGITKEFWNEKFGETVVLPGTTDTNRKGKENTNRNETTQLSRLYRYEGPAWYSKEINLSAEWKGKEIMLYLERTRPTTVWVDGKLVGKCDYLSVPHCYNLTSFLTPGKHKLTIRVDNKESIPSQIRSSSHSCTESTQTNWNGIIGRMELQGTNPLHITSLQVYPQVGDRSVKVKVVLSKALNKGEKLALDAEAFNTTKQHRAKAVEFSLAAGKKEYEVVFPLGKDALLWSDYAPVLYRLTASLGKQDQYSVNFGLREFKADGKQFSINGEKTFLRGKHDACVFPLTAHTPMGLAEWQHYFKVCKEYGINHVRFHSWCPPAACFEAADLEGIYLQPELTIWGSFKKDAKELMSFLLNDGEKIQQEYSNHPSFVMFALGNELGGDIDVMKSFIDRFRELESRHLYAYGSNNFLGWRGYVPGEDFLVTCRVGEGEGYSTHARASFSFADADEGGFLNNTYPNSEMNFDGALEKSPVPVVGHETGQFQIYPNYDEMKKYTGVLAPWNFEVFRARLQKAGMLKQADDFVKASGALSLLLYRADIEMNLRTRQMAGFQLLDLQDYSGQGSAYVGVLDAFMDSKGLITPEQWREFCCEVVPLFTTPKFCWTGNEQLSGKVEIANYSPNSLNGNSLHWELVSNGQMLEKGKYTIPAGTGLLDVSELSIQLPNVMKACKAEMNLKIEGTAYQNSYPLWIYPSAQPVNKDGITVTRALDDEAIRTLRQGGKVLLLPRREDCSEITVGGLFQSDYWNFRMFKSICDRIKKPASPGTLGILTNPEHPIFTDFPTEFHTNWQWFSIIKHSYPMILDRMSSDYLPVVQVIDNIERNHKLGLVFELNVEGGKLLVCMADLEAIQDKPEGRQFYTSLVNYMQSADFAPTTRLSAEELRDLFSVGVKAGGIKLLDNISYE
ncbi:sugar-binding domain-containing protein [Bacteroides sp.]|uniref:sugar-binding domain-containing protein n=1 Tax=Bacteroides sp. TaxID=29523 RepID=UPI00261D579A|nr:sugar-binding domain-containing protein [Bacteroides sp.]